MDKKFLNSLKCPITGQNLRLSNKISVEHVNQGIHKGKVKFFHGAIVSEKIETGIINEGSTYLYMVKGDIPCLIAEKAIILE